MLSVRNEDEQLIFEKLAKFALNVLCTPHSNAEPERAWSLERLLKTRFRNRLTTTSINALMQTISYLKLHGCKDVLNFQPTDEMYRLLGNHGYNNQENDDEDNDVMNLVRLLL